MATSATKQVQEKSVNPAALSTPERHLQWSAPGVTSAPSKKAVGYGLPCAHCHAYYLADMQVCPICKCPDRVSPNAPVVHSMPPVAPQPGTGAQIDNERERLLKELKAQAFASPTP